MDNQDNQIGKGRVAAKKTSVKKRDLSEFSVRLSGAGGEVSCAWIDKSQKFCDISELINFIEEQCDIVWYPQPQRKLRGWDV